MLRPRPLLTLMEQSLMLLDRVHGRYGGGKAAALQRQGLRGERAAYFHLRRLGYMVVARRWQQAPIDGEVDLIAWDGKTLCFIEVKTRDSRGAVAAEFRIDRDKEETLLNMAEAYLRQMPWRPGQKPDLTPRFDVVSVYMQPDGHADIRLLRDAFR